MEPSDTLAKERREMLTKGVAGLGALAAAGTQSASAAETVKRDGRLGLLITAPGLAISWVLFNILGPAGGQINQMNDIAKERESKENQQR